MKSSPEAVAILEKCKRQFLSALTFNASSDISRWIIAHSGGLDSQVLLALAYRLLPSSKLLVVHINHHLQDNSDHWADFSYRQASMLSLRHHVIDVFPENMSENAARKARYNGFEMLVKPGDCVLMGHHADDQAETILYRMLRGSGLLGLSGIAPMRSVGQGLLLRPLLLASRVELEQVASVLELEYINDPSNHDTHYDRNFLRHSVLPVLKQRWPNLLERWQKNAELAEDSYRLLVSYLESDLLSCMDSQGCLDIAQWRRFEERKAVALLRHWAYTKSGVHINQHQLQVIIRDVVNAQADANPVYILGAYKLRRFSERLYLDIESDELAGERRDHVLVKGPGKYDLGEAALRISAASGGLKTLSGVVIKRRQGGERCRPQGKKHSVSIKKLLQEAAIPPWLRADWPLLYVNDQVVAVPSICVCEGWYSEKSGFSALWCSFPLSGGC